MREFNLQLQKLNHAREDFDAGILHIMLSDHNVTHWQQEVGEARLNQAAKALLDIAEENINDKNRLTEDILNITNRIDRFSSGIATPGEQQSEKILSLRMEMEQLHSALRAILQDERVSRRYWFLGAIFCSSGLILGLFWSLSQNEAERERYHRELYISESRLALITDSIDEVFWLQDSRSGKILYVSSAFEKIWELPSERLYECADVWLEKVHPEDLEKVRNLYSQNQQKATCFDYRIVLDSGETRWIRDRIFPVESLNEASVLTQYIVAVASDITATKSLNDQLVVSQKLDSLGKLTGGIAHDFNNLLTVIMGNAQLIKDVLPEDSQLSDIAGLLVKAAERGATLNRQLLAFASKQHLQPERTEIYSLINEMLRLLRRTLGDEVSLDFTHANVVMCCYVDAGQLQNAIINLCINAKDAMPKGGLITIRLNLSDDKKYAVLDISDTGEGIADEILPHIFEPFFTTKQKHKGSGLGLSMVYGFVKQSGGDILVKSQKNRGTTFSLLLPLCADSSLSQADNVVKVQAAKKVLVVEDDAMVLNSIQQMLAGTGFDVLMADNGDSGLALLNAQGDIDILLTDVLMPGSLNGVALADIAKEQFPNLQILLMSGYVGNLDSLHPTFSRYGFLQKPFNKSQLLNSIQKFSVE